MGPRAPESDIVVRRQTSLRKGLAMMRVKESHL